MPDLRLQKECGGGLAYLAFYLLGIIFLFRAVPGQLVQFIILVRRAGSLEGGFEQALGVQAVKAATGSLIGSVAGMAVNLILSLVFLVLFILFALR